MEENATPTSSEKKRMNYSMYVIVVIVILVVVVGGMYLYKKNSQKTTVTPVMQPTQAMMAATTTPSTASSAATHATVQKFTVTSSNFMFTPKTLTVKKGQPVEITFKNSEGTHDFVIDEFKIKTQMVQSGQSETVTFTPDKAGTFDYYCSVGNHRAMGMQGTLTVE